MKIAAPLAVPEPGRDMVGYGIGRTGGSPFLGSAHKGGAIADAAGPANDIVVDGFAELADRFGT